MKKVNSRVKSLRYFLVKSVSLASGRLQGKKLDHCGMRHTYRKLYENDERHSLFLKFKQWSNEMH